MRLMQRIQHTLHKIALSGSKLTTKQSASRGSKAECRETQDTWNTQDSFILGYLLTLKAQSPCQKLLDSFLNNFFHENELIIFLVGRRK